MSSPSGRQDGRYPRPLHQWVRDEGIAQQPSEQQKELALALIRLDYCEDKLAGMLFLQEILLPAAAVDWPQDLPRFAALFEQGYIYDWNTCDWFCVRVLGPLVEQQGGTTPTPSRPGARRATSGSGAPAGVAFVNLAGEATPTFPASRRCCWRPAPPPCSRTNALPRPEPAGCCALSLAAPERVIDFVEQHIGFFSGEGLSYATAKLPAETRARLKAAHRIADRH